MPDKDNNFGDSLVWSLENDDVTCKPRIQLSAFFAEKSEEQ